MWSSTWLCEGKCSYSRNITYIRLKTDDMKVTVEENKCPENIFFVGNVIIRKDDDHCAPILLASGDRDNAGGFLVLYGLLLDGSLNRECRISAQSDGYKQFHGTITLEVGL